jgi:hypothetical protein
MKLTAIVFLSFLSVGLWSQDSLTVSQTLNTINLDKSRKFTLTSSLDRMTNSVNLPTPSILKQRSIFDVETLPIFCKFEHKIAKSSNVNVMMRLGSLDYVNTLEGKTP